VLTSTEMPTSDLSVRILQEIRDELRLSREEQKTFREEANTRFEVLETTLRDLAQQLVILSRGVKTAIESRTSSDQRLAELERRLEALEQKVS